MWWLGMQGSQCARDAGVAVCWSLPRELVRVIGVNGLEHSLPATSTDMMDTAFHINRYDDHSLSHQQIR